MEEKNSNTNSITGIDYLDTGDTTHDFSTHGDPYLIDHFEGCESLVMVYRQDPNCTYAGSVGVSTYSYDPVIYKIVYSVKDGKWHKSEAIYGTFVSAVEEGYEFNN